MFHCIAFNILEDRSNLSEGLSLLPQLKESIEDGDEKIIESDKDLILLVA